MSRLSNQSAESTIDRAANEISAIIANNGATFTSKSITQGIIALESLDAPTFQGIADTYGSVVSQLQESTLGVELLAGADPEQVELALEAAAMVIMSNGDAESYHRAFGKAPSSIDDGISVNPQQGNSDYNPDYALESFDPQSMDKYVASDAIAAALSMVSGGFKELFFPTILVPAGQDGVDVNINVPKVFAGVTRDATGAPTNFVKTSIVDAMVDSTVLDADSISIVPYASSPVLPASLVPAADVPTTQRLIDGVSIDTRPIAFGSTVDLIGLSSAPGLISGGAFDETDSLDRIINIGTVFYTLTVTDGVTTVPVVLSTDISTQLGSLLTRAADGSVNDYVTNMVANVVVNQNTTAVAGNMAAAIAIIETNLGIVAGTAFTVVIELAMSASANNETAEMTVYANRAGITKAFDATMAPVPVTPFSTASVTALGYNPAATRTNTNARTAGILLDATNTVRYRFPVPLGSPIVSKTAIGAPVNTTVSALVQAINIRNDNNAVKALLNMETILNANNGLPINSPAMGSELVTPTIINRVLTVGTKVVSLGSDQALANLRGQMYAALTNIGNELVNSSNYLAAIEFANGKAEGFELIVVTDPSIASHLRAAEQVVTLESKRKVVISQSLNSAFRGKIYMSVRRVNRNGMHPLDFGATLATPSRTVELQVSRSSATVRETSVIPRIAEYVTLPVLATLDVVGLDRLFVD